MPRSSVLELDEYEAWMESPQETDISVQDPIQYWHDLRFKYPRLSRMALEFFTIQYMSAECERLFSAAGLMVTPERNRLEASTIGICQVLRSWLRAGVIDELDPIFVFVADEAIQQLVNDDVIGAPETSASLDTTSEDMEEG